MGDKIDEKFDKAEKIIDRSKKLILQIIGTILAISITLYAGIDQLLEDEPQGDSVIVDSCYQDSVEFNEFREIIK
jgi:hypothetical protein